MTPLDWFRAWLWGWQVACSLWAPPPKPPRRELTHEQMRQRLRERIAEKDAARGRPLTDRERLENLHREIYGEQGPQSNPAMTAPVQRASDWDDERPSAKVVELFRERGGL